MLHFDIVAVPASGTDPTVGYPVLATLHVDDTLAGRDAALVLARKLVGNPHPVLELVEGPTDDMADLLIDEASL